VRAAVPDTAHPRWLAVSGLIGYPILAAGTIAEIFGVHIGLYLTIPGFFL
jgi:hypothetical protein